MSDTIFLQVGTEDRITLPDFIDTLSNFRFILKNLDATISQDSRGSMYWEVVSLEKNSPPLVGVAPQLRRGRRDVSSLVEHQLIENSRLLSSGIERTKYMSDTALTYFEMLAKRSKKLGPMEIFIGGNGSKRPKVKAHISEISYQHVQQLTGVKYSAFGSIFGSLDTISVHKGNEFRVWDEVTNKAVRCRFGQDDLERVKSYLGQRVMVAGIVQSNMGGNPISVMVDQVEQMTKPTLPTIEEMSGFVKDFTEGQSLKEYIDQISDE